MELCRDDLSPLTRKSRLVVAVVVEPVEAGMDRDLDDAVQLEGLDGCLAQV